jgi:hypothetical protein
MDQAGSLSGVAAFKNPSDGAFAIIAINKNGSDIQNVSFGFSGANVTGSITPYVTSGTPIGALGSDGNLSAGSASLTFPPLCSLVVACLRLPFLMA